MNIATFGAALPANVTNAGGPALPGHVATASDIAGMLPGAAGEAVALAIERQAGAEALASDLLDAPGLAALLSTAVATPGPHADFSIHDTTAVPLYGSLTAAGQDLARVAGLAFGDAEEVQLAGIDERLDAELRDVVLDLIGALVVAAELRADAFSPLTVAEMSELQVIVADVGTDAFDEARFAALVADVGTSDLATAGHVVLSAVDAALPRLVAFAESGRLPLIVEPQPDDPHPLSGDCGTGMPTPAVDVPTLLAIGSTPSEAYEGNYILSLDLGGNDAYCNNAGGNAAPGCFSLNPVALAIDVAGDDAYHSPPVQAGSAVQNECGIEGSGILGIGVLVDAQGHDSYNSHRSLATAARGTCPTPDQVGYAVRASQGAGVAGVGVLADLPGRTGVSTLLGDTDDYNSFIEMYQCNTDPQDTLDYTVSLAQGAGLSGVGIHVDAGLSRDHYNSNNTLVSDKQDILELGNEYVSPGNNIYLAQHVQGVGLGQGIGVFVDVAGDDVYNSQNYLEANPNPKTMLLGEPPQSTSLFDVKCAQGMGGRCGEAEEHPHPEAAPDQGPGGNELDLVPVGGVGVMVEADGHDLYNCANDLFGSKAEHVQHTRFGADTVQGAGRGLYGLGVLVDGFGDDCYNSLNKVDCPHPFFVVDTAQGAASSHISGPRQEGPLHEMPELPEGGVVGVLVDAQGHDLYNSVNEIIAFQGAAPDSFATWSIRIVQGSASGDATFGVHADLTGVGRPVVGQGFEVGPSAPDLYNSRNVISSTSGAGTGEIVGAQGSAVQSVVFDKGSVFAGVGVHVDATTDLVISPSPGLPDEYNSHNSGAGTLTIFGALGAVVAPLSADAVGIGVHVDIGKEDDYVVGNSFAGGSDTYVRAAADAAGIAAFVDVSFPLDLSTLLGFPDTYGPNSWGATGPSSDCTGPNTIFLDLLDGSDAPPFAGGLICLDLL